MQQLSSVVCTGPGVQQHGNRAVLRCIALGLWLGCALGCGTEQVEAPAGPERTELAVPEARAPGPEEHGLSVNGLSVNGLSVNGLSVNGLSVNGLSVNGLQALSFRSWFEVEPAAREVVMKYVVQCAVPEGQSRTYQSAVTGRTYSWPGRLGLTPGWSAGAPATLAEQQVITACLAAHANKFGVHIGISVLGRNALEVPLPYTPGELATYSEPEACFFGNAFTGQGLFAATDRKLLTSKESTSRACGLSSRRNSIDCPPMVHLGSCKDLCTMDATRTFYTQCTYRGVAYRPLTTRILPADIYSCGDKVCQFTESCGNGDDYDNCRSDCGRCK